MRRDKETVQWTVSPPNARARRAGRVGFSAGPDGAKSGRGCLPLGGRGNAPAKGQAGAARFRHVAEIGRGGMGSNCLSACLSSVVLACAHHGVEDGEQLAGAGGDGELGSDGPEK